MEILDEGEPVPPPLQNNGDTEAIALLEKTSLVSFEAVPASLSPWESSTLSWRVNAPGAVSIVLDGTTVGKSGERVVEPLATYAYNLHAKVGSGIKQLGYAVVSVNLSQCRIWDLPFLDAWIQEGIIAKAPTMLPKGASLSGDPAVTITPGQIQIVLKAVQEINVTKHHGFHATATITMSFGLTLVTDLTALQRSEGLVATRLASTNLTYSVDVSVPPEIWLIPGAMPFLGIAESMAEGSIDSSVPPIAQAIVDGLEAFQPFPGLVKHSVTIGVTDKNVANLEITWCPPPQQEATTGNAP